MLLLPTVKIESLGGSLDDLLGVLLDNTKAWQDPRSRNSTPRTSALEHVNDSLDLCLKIRQEIDAVRGGKALVATKLAGVVSAKRRRQNSRANAWRYEVETRKHGSKEQMYRKIERRELLKPGSVKKAILRLSKRREE